MTNEHKNKLENKAWYRFLQVFFGFFIFILICVNIFFLFVLKPSPVKTVDIDNAYYICFGDQVTRNPLSESQKDYLKSKLPGKLQTHTVDEIVKSYWGISDAQLADPMIKKCHLVYSGGKSDTWGWGEKDLGTFESGNNYAIIMSDKLEDKNTGYYMSFMGIVLLEIIALLVIRGLALYVFIGKKAD